MKKHIVLKKFLLVFSILILCKHSYAQDSVDTNILRRAILTESVFYVGGMSYLGLIWYKDKERVPFNFYNDGKGYLQIDKFGHAYGSYIESYIGYKWLRKAGVNKKKSLIFGGGLGFVLQAPIEIFDGLYEGWGFSWWDVAANLSGALLVVGQEMAWDNQPLRLKFSFSRSVFAEQGNGYLGDTKLESLFLDYNGHTYWISGGLDHIFKESPPWLNLAIGYSANGMYGEFNNRTFYRGEYLPQYRRTRQLLLSPDINWEKIPTKNKFLKHIFFALNFIKLPAPALEWEQGNGFSFKALYF